MDQSSREIQREREQTRAALTEKIELLEECVRDTKKAVKQKFDYRYQTEKQPWKMLGASVVVGYLVGRTIGPRPASGTLPAQRARPAGTPQKGTIKGTVLGALFPMVVEFVKTASLRGISSRGNGPRETHTRDQSRVLTPFRDEPSQYPAGVSTKPGGESHT
jgi:hypothetical protein